MIKSIATALVAAAAMLGAGAAHAGGHVSWSIGINTPVVGTVISNGPVYYPPVDVYLPVAIYEPAPVYRVAPPVAYYPRYSGYYGPVPVVYPRYTPGWRHGHRHWQHRGWRHD